MRPLPLPPFADVWVVFFLLWLMSEIKRGGGGPCTITRHACRMPRCFRLSRTQEFLESIPPLFLLGAAPSRRRYCASSRGEMALGALAQHTASSCLWRAVRRACHFAHNRTAPAGSAQAVERMAKRTPMATSRGGALHWPWVGGGEAWKPAARLAGAILRACRGGGGRDAH